MRPLQVRSIILLFTLPFLVPCYPEWSEFTLWAESTPAPDFTLVDLNPNSSTYGEDLSLRGIRGSVVGLYFARPICMECIEDVIALESLYQENLEEWTGRVVIMILNPAGYLDYIDNLFPYTTFPVCLEDEGGTVFEDYDAEYSNLFLITGDGYLFRKFVAPPEDIHELEPYIDVLVDDAGRGEG